MRVALDLTCRNFLLPHQWPLLLRLVVFIRARFSSLILALILGCHNILIHTIDAHLHPLAMAATTVP